MGFSLLVGNMPFFVFCKFEILIFKIVQVMTENIPFAFLYVLSIAAHSAYDMFSKYKYLIVNIIFSTSVFGVGISF